MAGRPVMTHEAALTGERTRLRPVREEDLALFVRWLNDPDVRHWQHRSDGPQETLESQQRRHEHNRDDAAHVGWCVEIAGNRAIGNVGLQGIDAIHGRAELYIFIGEKDCWSKGHGTDAIQLTLGYAFLDLGLRRVGLIVDADNERGIRCYEKCGFEREGLLRGHRLRYGKPIDMLVMGVLRDGWNMP
jgi:RimJ/RimL family protein N-acetyltransferase